MHLAQTRSSPALFFVTSHHEKEKAERCTEGASNTVGTVVRLAHTSAGAILRPTNLRQISTISTLCRSSRSVRMYRDPEQLRRELADLVNDQADTADIETLTDEERRGYEERQELINELCDELHRIATTIHADDKATVQRTLSNR